MEALAAHAPSIAEVGVLVDVGLVEIDQMMPVALGGDQYRAQPRDESLALRGIGTVFWPKLSSRRARQSPIFPT